MTLGGEQRRATILRRLLGDGAELTTSRLCEVTTEVTGATGAGIMFIASEIARGTVCASDTVSALIEQLQYDLGEGPCIDAFHQDRPVIEPDLAHPEVPRWLAFSGPVLDAGARAVFGFPLQVGAVRLGALNLYNDRSGQLTDDQHADALVMADVVAQSVLLLQASAPIDAIADELETNANFQYVVHQASGMVAAQLDTTISHALIRLRAHAFGNGSTLTDVARDVVDRQLRFDADSGDSERTP